MSVILRTVLAGIVSLATMAAFQPLQAQPPIVDPLFFAGVVGEPPLQSMLSTQGAVYTFPAAARPIFVSLLLSPFGPSIDYVLGGSLDANRNYNVIAFTRVTAATEPSFVSGRVDLRDGTSVVATRDIYAVIFSTAVHRDAFLYYVQQREAAATEADYLYFTALGAYEFWVGQENEGLSLYAYYTGMAEYLREIAADPQQGEYDYYYNIGLGAYYYFVGIGDQESADLAFYYHYQLAVAALDEVPQDT